MQTGFLVGIPGVGHILRDLQATINYLNRNQRNSVDWIQMLQVGNPSAPSCEDCNKPAVVQGY
jgi:hypothetical protein